MTTQGVLRGTGFNRRPEDERWTTDDWDKLKGLPWDMVPKASLGREAEVFADKEAVGLPISSAPQGPPAAAPAPAKERYVLRADIDKFGPTPGCPGCADYTAKGLGTLLTAQRAHNDTPLRLQVARARCASATTLRFAAQPSTLRIAAQPCLP